MTWTEADQAIISCIRDHSPRPHPSARRLSKMTGYSIRTVRRTNAKIKAIGWDVIPRYRKNGSQSSNLYRLPQPRIEESRRSSYEKAASKARQERVTPPRSKPRTFQPLPRLTRSASRRNFGRRRRWRSEMGEVVPLNGGSSPAKTNATVGQALFTAIMDELDAQGVAAIPRSLVATAAKQGTAALNDGVQPEIVLAGCLTALAQGKPQFTTHIIGDLCFAKAGALMTPTEYRQLLSLENRQNNPAVASVREALAGHQRKAIEKGEQ